MNQKSLQITIVLSTLLLASGLVLGLWVQGHGQTNDVITVTGSTKRSATADLAKWTAVFSRQTDPSNLKTLLDQSNQDTQKIRAFIQGYGITAEAMTFVPLQTNAVYDYNQAQKLTGYMSRQEVHVEGTDIAKIEQLAQDAKKLIDQGIVPQEQHVDYIYTKLADVRPTLFAEATKDAQKRAEAIAAGTGVKVGRLRSARTGVIQILPPNSVEVSDYGSYDLSTKAKEISATVSVSFSLQ